MPPVTLGRNLVKSDIALPGNYQKINGCKDEMSFLGAGRPISRGKLAVFRECN